MFTSPAPSPPVSGFIASLALVGRACLIVGSGSEAEQRALRLLECGALVTLVAGSMPEGLLSQHERGMLRFRQGLFEESDFEQQWLAVLTDRDPSLAERMLREAERRRVFFCAIDQPQASSFAHLAEARSGELTIAISTSGRIPALASHLRKELQRLLDQAGFVNFFARLSDLRRTTPEADRRSVLARVLGELRFSGKLELPEIPPRN